MLRTSSRFSCDTPRSIPHAMPRLPPPTWAILPSMRRDLFEDVHEDFRASFRTFLEREVVGEDGRYGEWERDGLMPREVFELAGRGGFLAMAVPEAHGGA